MSQRSADLSPEQQELCRATRQLVRAFGGQEAAAMSSGYRQQRLSDWCLPTVADFATLDFVDALEDMTRGQPGWPHITRLFAGRRGFLLVPRVEAAGENALMAHVAEIAAELGDVSRRITDALRDDGAVDAAEADGILAEMTDLETAAAGLRLHLEAICAQTRAGAGRKGAK